MWYWLFGRLSNCQFTCFWRGMIGHFDLTVLIWNRLKRHMADLATRTLVPDCLTQIDY